MHRPHAPRVDKSSIVFKSNLFVFVVPIHQRATQPPFSTPSLFSVSLRSTMMLLPLARQCYLNFLFALSTRAAVVWVFCCLLFCLFFYLCCLLFCYFFFLFSFLYLCSFCCFLWVTISLFLCCLILYPEIVTHCWQILYRFW
jgi:hypothetical protein